MRARALKLDTADALYALGVACVAIGVGMMDVAAACVAVGGLLVLPVIVGWLKG